MPVAFPWLRAAPYLAILLLIGFIAFQGSRIDGLKGKLETCESNRAADQSAYRAAQAEAKAKNLEDVRKQETEWKAANNETVRDLHSRLELLRRELRKGTPAPQGHSGSAGVPQAGGEPGTPEEARVCLAPDEFLRAAENEERHDQLITLIERLIQGGSER
jgi:sarcosine oxidase gamma subunit